MAQKIRIGTISAQPVEDADGLYEFTIPDGFELAADPELGLVSDHGAIVTVVLQEIVPDAELAFGGFER